MSADALREELRTRDQIIAQLALRLERITNAAQGYPPNTGPLVAVVNVETAPSDRRRISIDTSEDNTHVIRVYRIEAEA